MSIELFAGEWKSAGHHWHSNPEQKVPDVQESEHWPFRGEVWYPDGDVEFEATVEHRNIYLSYQSPKTTPTEVKIIKLQFKNDGNLDPGVIQAIEQADYHYEQGLLISTPIRLDAETWVVDVIEYLPTRSLIPGQQPSSQPAMKHNLLWQDGLRTKWICCPLNAAAAREHERSIMGKMNPKDQRGKKKGSKD